jgi:hypothetical protein
MQNDGDFVDVILLYLSTNLNEGKSHIASSSTHAPSERKFRRFEFFRNGTIKKGKGLPQQAEVAQGVPGRLSSGIYLTCGTTRVVGRHLYAPAAFTPGEIPVIHF